MCNNSTAKSVLDQYCKMELERTRNELRDKVKDHWIILFEKGK